MTNTKFEAHIAQAAGILVGAYLIVVGLWVISNLVHGRWALGSNDWIVGVCALSLGSALTGATLVSVLHNMPTQKKGK